jgi:hypothetical protein
MGWVIFWLLCGIASSIIAGNKGRSGFGWFLFGCLLGPFGIVFALMVSKQTQAELDAERRAAWSADTAPFRPRSIVSFYCGKDLPTKPNGTGAPPETRFEAWL